MNQPNLTLIIEEYKNKFIREGHDVLEDELSRVASQAIIEANSAYLKLGEPRLMKKSFYLVRWVREKLNEYYGVRTMIKVSAETVDASGKALYELIKLFSPKLQGEIMAELSKEKSYQKQWEIWNSKNLPIDEIKNKLVALTKARNESSQKKGYKSFIHLSLEANKVPVEEYEKLKDNFDNVIKHCNKNLPEIRKPDDFYSEFQSPCYLCEIKFPDLAYPDDVLRFVTREFPTLDEVKSHVSVKIGDSSSIIYRKEFDKFEIKIGKKLNNRHKTLDLIHELCHIIVQIGEFKNNIDPLEMGKYHEEKKDAEIFLPLLEKLSPEVYKANLGEVLMLIRRELFELSLYENPDQDLDHLYSETFNRCFVGANQKDNPFYLFGTPIVFKPLSSLPQMVATVNLLASKIK